MKQFQIELDETIYLWLKHIAQTTNQPIETVISNSIHNHISSLEDSVMSAFTYKE